MAFLVVGNIYKKCEDSDILCGRIQCINIDEVPNLNEHHIIIQTPPGNNSCLGTRYRNGTGTTDVGMVKDGTQCGSGMICLNSDCITVSLLSYDCNQTKCHNRGVCNSHKNCHCNYGWAPPYCVNEGYGGSIDSGPSPANSSNIGKTASIALVLFVICCCCCSWSWG